MSLATLEWNSTFVSCRRSLCRIISKSLSSLSAVLAGALACLRKGKHLARSVIGGSTVTLSVPLVSLKELLREAGCSGLVMVVSSAKRRGLGDCFGNIIFVRNASGGRCFQGWSFGRIHIHGRGGFETSHSSLRSLPVMGGRERVGEVFVRDCRSGGKRAQGLHYHVE